MGTAFIIALLAGAIASVTGFGIGSILTPLFSLQMDTKIAITAVAIPHLSATLLRFWTLRGHVDRSVFRDFGIASAAGGLTGAVLHAFASSRLLTLVFGLLLVVAGLAELTGLSRRVRFGPGAARLSGAASGLLGGMVGNQGGIRSAALLGFNLSREAFVATATAIALVVDAARVPVYVATGWREWMPYWPQAAVATAGVLAGTLFGGGMLRRIPEKVFRPTVASVILALGIEMLWQL